MKKIMLLIFTFLLVTNIFAQVGIGTTTPNSSAALEISDSTRGLLIPRMTMVKRQAIGNPAEGLLVYQTDNTKGIWYYSNSAWRNLLDNTSGAAGNPGFSNQLNSKTGSMIVLYTNSNAYGFTRNGSGGSLTWYPITLTGTPVGAVALDSIIMIYTTNAAFAFKRNVSGSPTWYTQSITGTSMGITGIGNMIVVSTSTNLYGFTENPSGSATWYVNPISAIPVGSVAGSSGNNKDCIVVYTASSAYAFTPNSSDGSPTWYPQLLTGIVSGSSTTGNLVVLFTSNTAYGFGRNLSNTPTWYPQSLTGIPAGVSPE